MQTRALPVGGLRLVHLDLKGAPPRLDYLEKLFGVLSAWGATGVLVEWEDTFPYSGRLQALGSRSAAAPSAPSAADAPYSLPEAVRIIQLAAENNLILIQLVQCMGHMEYVLKHPAWRGLREHPDYPSSLCPSHGGALPLVLDALTQALQLQKYAQYIHIGADEVWHMGLCAACERRAAESPHGAAALFLEHVAAVAAFLRERYPRVRVLVWDDMLRSLSVDTLQAFNLGSLVQPMVWHYNPAETFSLGPALWEKYGAVFEEVWVASAFKGASGSCQMVPSLKQHVSNQEGWMKELELNSGRIRRVAGVVLTGWSRYDHYATLCELLPVGLPSLALCLAAWAAGTPERTPATRRAVHADAVALLGCEPEQPHQIESAAFPGWELYKSVHAFTRIHECAVHLLDGDLVQTWLNPWQLEHRYTNPMQIQCILRTANELLSELRALEGDMSRHLAAVLYPHSADEWLGSRAAPLRARLLRLRGAAEGQLRAGAGVRPLRDRREAEGGGGVREAGSSERHRVERTE